MKRAPECLLHLAGGNHAEVFLLFSFGSGRYLQWELARTMAMGESGLPGKQQQSMRGIAPLAQRASLLRPKNTEEEAGPGKTSAQIDAVVGQNDSPSYDSPSSRHASD